MNRDTDDEVIAQVRAAKESYAARFGYDVTAIFAHLAERERMRTEPRTVSPGSSAEPATEPASAN
jgi:hypothetical protein